MGCVVAYITGSSVDNFNLKIDDMSGTENKGGTNWSFGSDFNEKQINHFVLLVKRMRENQKMFFKTRGNYYLSESKALEKQVDNELIKMENPSLFDQ